MSSTPAPQSPRKGLHPLAWVAIGCAGLLVVGGIVAALVGMFLLGKAKQFAEEAERDPVLATAKLIAAANPEIELAGQDQAKQTITFRNVKTGEEFTFDYKDIQEGKVRFSSAEEGASIDIDTSEAGEGKLTVASEEGRLTVGAGAAAVPAWLPAYPGTTPEGNYTGESEDVRAGAYTIRTRDSLKAVVDFYAAKLEAAGLQIASRVTTPQGVVLMAASPDDSRTSTVTASSEGGETQVVVHFMDKVR